MKNSIKHDNIIPKPPFFGTRRLEKISLKTILTFINMRILGDFLWDIHNELEAKKILNRLVIQNEQENIMRLQALYGYFACQSDGNKLIVYANHNKTYEFLFPISRVCIADFFRPQSSNEFDVIAFQLVTVGKQASDYAQKLFRENKYQDYLFWKGLNAATANAMAEFVHKIIRIEYGFISEEPTDTKDIFQQKYRGARYSFGYPACPNLADQKKILQLLDAKRIGVTLSETYQLIPEESTSAIVVHHPQASRW